MAALAQYTSPYSTPSRASFWKSPRGILAILSALCFFLFFFSPVADDTVRLPLDWDSARWRDTEPLAKDAFDDSIFSKVALSGADAPAPPTPDEWDTIKQKQEEARVRKQEHDRIKQKEQEEAAKRRKEAAEAAVKEQEEAEAAARRKKEAAEAEARQKEEADKLKKQATAAVAKDKEDEERRKKNAAEAEVKKQPEEDAAREKSEVTVSEQEKNKAADTVTEETHKDQNTSSEEVIQKSQPGKAIGKSQEDIELSKTKDVPKTTLTTESQHDTSTITGTAASPAKINSTSIEDTKHASSTTAASALSTKLRSSSNSKSTSSQHNGNSTSTTGLGKPTAIPPKKGSTEEQKQIADKQREKADSADPANMGEDSSKFSTSSNSSTADLRVSVDDENSGTQLAKPTNPNNLTTTLVVGRLDDDVEGVKWIHDYVKDLTHKRIYIVDDPKAPLHLNRNKGREAMVYLRYILDFYDKLDDVTLFYHSSRMAWHNNVLFNRDAAIMINNLRRDHVLKVGYMNARCELYPGCQKPGWIKFDPTKAENDVHWERNADLFNKKLWDRLFPNRTHDPFYLSQACCSQFAVSKAAIRNVPKEQYQRIHDWLGTTDEFDGYTGRIMEYMWQYLFLNKDESCPSMSECYCKGYGTCMDDDAELREYNSLRTQVDDILKKLGDLDAANGCGQIYDKAENEACRANNPWEAPLKDVRRRKGALERLLPAEYGSTDPLERR